MADTSPPETAPASGPVLFFRGADAGFVRLAATVIRPAGATPPVLEAEGARPEPEALATEAGATVWRYGFSLPTAAETGFTLDGTAHLLATDLAGDLRIAYVSCNGQEVGDLERPDADRNAMWENLGAEHDARPFHLLLHGGDQLYADEMTLAHRLSRDWPDAWPDRLDPREEADLAATLARVFFLRYAVQQAQPGYARAVAAIPSLSMWDDHDICDGWGSLPGAALDSPVGRILFRAARDAFKLFQMGCRPDEVPEICLSPAGASLGWAVHLPGLSVIAPDLRTTRRPTRVMGADAWADLEAGLAAAGPGRVLLMSSVPALGPRLSLVERAMGLTRRMERYEDDLRDQWQSRSHRAEWQRLLKALIAVHERPETDVTVVSGEIHLATRGTMATASGPMHQLVASGISHPAPHRAYAAALGLLARLGEAPLAGYRVRLHALPGQGAIYAAERNFLILTRTGDAWSARWELESSGPTPPLAL